MYNHYEKYAQILSFTRTKKQKDGNYNSQALFSIMRSLVRIVYGMIKNKTAYILPDQPETKVS